MLGLSLSLTGVAVRGSVGGGGGSVESITAAGGTVKDGEQFNVYYASGGLTGATSVTINGIACTGLSVTDDNNLLATAPSNDLLHGQAYDLVVYLL